MPAGSSGMQKQSYITSNIYTGLAFNVQIPNFLWCPPEEAEVQAAECS